MDADAVGGSTLYYIDYYSIKERGSMRAEDDLTYQEYKEDVEEKISNSGERPDYT